jgi:hypothetical protein
MRPTYRTVLLTLVATAALAAFASASAFAALPEFSPAGGTGTKERIKFKIKAGEHNFSESNGNSWSGKSITGSGEITGAKEVSNVVLTVNEIHTLNPCTTSGGTLTTNKLSGRLGYINTAKKEVGLLLEASTPPVAKCHTEVEGDKEYRGAWIGALTPINLKSSHLTLTYKQALPGTQNPTKFEGELGVNNLAVFVQSSGFEQAKMAEVSGTELETFKRGEEALGLTIVG